MIFTREIWCDDRRCRRIRWKDFLSSYIEFSVRNNLLDDPEGTPREWKKVNLWKRGGGLTGRVLRRSF